MTLPIYMDYNATTPVDPRVLEAMLPYFTEIYGNAASQSHNFGWTASQAVEAAREKVATLIGATPQEIVFTSGATESDNLAIKGVAQAYAARGKHIVTCATEHKAVLDTCKALEADGWEVDYLPPDEDGLVSAEQVAAALRPDTALVTLMVANNETGTIHPIAEIAKVVREKDIFFHTDATQAVGKIPINVDDLGVDLLSLSGHKLYGPKGVGALYVRRTGRLVKPAIQMHGGGHERNMRSGTLNVPGIVGLGEACRLAGEEMEAESARLTRLRDALEDAICSRIDFVKRNGSPDHRLPNTTNLSFAFIEGEGLMAKLRDVIAVSSGSACTSASLSSSHVLKAMGVPDVLAHASIRFSLGKDNHDGEAEFVAEKLVAAVAQLRDMSPLYDFAKDGGLTDDLKFTKWVSPLAAACSYQCLRENCRKEQRTSAEE